MNRKNKKAVSEIVSYILLIVITLSLVGSIYGWMKFRASVPSESACSEDTTLIVKKYECDFSRKIISLSIENKGMFNIDGFFIRASNNQNQQPTIPLLTLDTKSPIEGRYYFGESPLAPGISKITNFNYSNAVPLEKLQIQPLVIAEDKVSLCDNIVTFNIELAECKE